MITTTVDLWNCAYPTNHMKFVPATENQKEYWLSFCPVCGEEAFMTTYDSRSFSCSSCKRRFTMFSFCKDILGLNGEELVRFVLQKEPPYNSFDYLDFACIVHKWHSSATFTIDKPQEWDFAPWEKTETCCSCGCPHFMYDVYPNKVDVFCCFCGRKIAPLHKTSVKGAKRNNLHAQWSYLVHLRYGNKCALCGSTEDLHAHHIVAWKVCEENRYNVNNGILLCKKHHDLAHKNPCIFKPRKGNEK